MVLIELEFVSTEDSGYDEREFHLGDVASDTSAWAVGEGNEG